jgi:hypothetical protein
MRTFIKKTGMLFIFSLLSVSVNSQYNWKIITDKEGIKVFESETKNSAFKSIKVECLLQGTFDKLIALITDVPGHKNWVYRSKTAYILKKNSPSDFYFYSETSVPWPMTNRDLVAHMIINRDNEDRFLKITATGVPDYIPEKKRKVRVSRSLVNWHVTMPSSNSISIVYILEADPGGSVPAWMVNMFIDKGPFESFKKLSGLLKK